MSFNTDYQRSKLLNKYYEKIGMTAAGQGSCPVFTLFAAGFGLVDETDPENPVLQDIPPNMTEVPREFYRAEVEASYSNGQTICKCEIPVGGVDTPQRFNLIGIFDQDGDLVAVCTTLPDWVTPNEADRAYPVLTFPIEPVEGDGAGGDGGTDGGDTDGGDTDTGDSGSGTGSADGGD